MLSLLFEYFLTEYNYIHRYFDGKINTNLILIN